MIEAKDLTKRYGDTLAVDDLSFTVHPGVVTGFLGPKCPGSSGDAGRGELHPAIPTRPDHPADRRHAPPRRHNRFDKYNYFDMNSR